MKFVTIRELRTQSGQVWARLNENHNLVITNNGRPVAVLSEVNEDNLEPTLAAIRRSRAMAAVEAMRSASIRQGTNRMSLAEIDAEIKAVRTKASRESHND